MVHFTSHQRCISYFQPTQWARAVPFYWNNVFVTGYFKPLWANSEHVTYIQFGVFTLSKTLNQYYIVCMVNLPMLTKLSIPNKMRMKNKNLNVKRLFQNIKLCMWDILHQGFAASHKTHFDSLFWHSPENLWLEFFMAPTILPVHVVTA